MFKLKCPADKSTRSREPSSRWSRIGVAILLMLFVAQSIGMPVQAAEDQQERLPSGYYDGVITLSAVHGFSVDNYGAEEVSYIKIFTTRGRIRFRILSSGQYSNSEMYFPYVVYYHSYYQYVADAPIFQGFTIAARGAIRSTPSPASGAPNLVIGTVITALAPPVNYETPSIAFHPFGEGCDAEYQDLEFQSLQSVLNLLFSGSWEFRARPPFGRSIGGNCVSQTLENPQTNWSYTCTWRAHRTGR